MRIYLSSTLADLAAGLQAGAFAAAGDTAFAVTPALRADYEVADEEELEYLAMLDAARGSLRLIGRQEGDDRKTLRVVLAADVDGAVPREDLDRAAVTLAYPVAWKQVASVHVDGADATEAVAAAAAVIDAADIGDDDAEFVLGSAEDFELAWYAPGEISYLLGELGVTTES
ncbi:hypothetical protein D1871_16550 [Nakamurella silvestris]|nr:hypothetical protein D1871_16550 [Nakamurella silvestris]